MVEHRPLNDIMAYAILTLGVFIVAFPVYLALIASSHDAGPVVGGHMLGAWGGHVVASLEAPREIVGRKLTLRQVPLAVVMVALTTLTLWSLGQAIVVTPEQPATTAVQAVATSRG